MKARKITVQPFEGGPETSFFEVPPCELRAAAAFAGDPAFDMLDQTSRNFLVGVAFVILSAKKRGLGEALGCPVKLDSASAEDWASRYMVEFEQDDIPQEPSGNANPTVPKE